MAKTALIIGIDHYEENRLYGCVRDAKKLDTLLSWHASGEKNFDCYCYTTPKKTITESFLRQEIRKLFKADLTTALFYFSGHGYADRFGGYLVTQDAKDLDLGLSMQELINYANGSDIKEIIIILDCCHAGAMGDLPNVVGNQAILREGVTIIASSRKNEGSQEIGGEGLFSTLFFEALGGGAADILGNVSIASAYSYVDQALRTLDQRALFKSNTLRLNTIRKCEPEVELKVLRKLTDYFSEPGIELKLDPSYEPTAEPKNEENQEIFSHLQQFRALRLVTPVGTDHLYYAAMESKPCVLTPIGKFYWKLIKKGKI